MTERSSARYSDRYSARCCGVAAWPSATLEGRGQRVEGRGQRVEGSSSGYVQLQQRLSNARVAEIGVGGDAA